MVSPQKKQVQSEGTFQSFLSPDILGREYAEHRMQEKLPCWGLFQGSQLLQLLSSSSVTWKLM